MKQIPLTQGLYAIVDDDDYEKFKDKPWCAHIATKTKKHYAKSNKSKSMHRIIMGVSDPRVQVDHINGNTLDNRKSNLRLCSNRENQYNRSKYVTNTTGFKGVFRSGKNYRVQLCKNKKAYSGGSYKNIIEAAKAYNDLAIKHFGEFAHLNQI